MTTSTITTVRVDHACGHHAQFTVETAEHELSDVALLQSIGAGHPRLDCLPATLHPAHWPPAPGGSKPSTVSPSSFRAQGTRPSCPPKPGASARTATTLGSPSSTRLSLSQTGTPGATSPSTGGPLGSSISRSSFGAGVSPDLSTLPRPCRERTPASGTGGSGSAAHQPTRKHIEVSAGRGNARLHQSVG